MAVQTIKAIEKSTYVITVSFTDENGAAVTPDAGLNWSLTDMNGNYINSRQDVVISPATSVNVVLSGDDLKLTGAKDSGRRVLTVQGTYDSTLGSDLPLKGETQFDITDLDLVA